MEKKLPETHVFNEDLTVKENKEKLEKYNKKVSKHNKKIDYDYYKNEQKVYEKLLNDTRLAIQHELGVDLELSEKLINKHLRYSYSILLAIMILKKIANFLNNLWNTQENIYQTQKENKEYGKICRQHDCKSQSTIKIK